MGAGTLIVAGLQARKHLALGRDDDSPQIAGTLVVYQSAGLVALYSSVGGRHIVLDGVSAAGTIMDCSRSESPYVVPKGRPGLRRPGRRGSISNAASPIGTIRSVRPGSRGGLRGRCRTGGREPGPATSIRATATTSCPTGGAGWWCSTPAAARSAMWCPWAWHRATSR